ncbi:A-kinase-interacting protein 1 isoform X2 [Carassius carassius]|uniref:A-kinase-interacting protein 1 isoform X2 n=1 Tax=Carassius carassius TaxID=217509 RepID=UPI002868919E|nr:A-kinase-interacting protein 1 isoform X2 [Carassius carassius]
MASESWLESSLRRSSKLGQEVLEKAKRRSVSCSRPRPPVLGHNERNSERDILHSNLDHAFAKIVEYMSETTRQCKRFYETVNQAQPSEREHICRYHSQQMLRTADQKQNASAAIKRDYQCQCHLLDECSMQPVYMKPYISCCNFNHKSIVKKLILSR